MLHCVITGPKGVGKSTVVRRVLDDLGWREPAGFLTRKTFGQPGEISLLIGTWRGDFYPIAYANSPTEPPSAPCHRLDTEALMRFTARHLSGLSDDIPVVLDELGILELQEGRFTSVVADLFRRRGALLAVIQQRAFDSWMKIIESGSIHQVYEVSPDNRDTLPRVISMAFRDR